MRVTLKTEYALRALVALSRHAPGLVKAEVLVTEESLPRDFVQLILGELRRAGLVQTRRGSEGGYALAVPADRITVGQVVRIVDGPLTEVPALLPEQADTPSGPSLARLWAALSSSVEEVLDDTTIADVAAGRLPEHVESRARRDARRVTP
jgi:Rrf2 family protein